MSLPSNITETLIIVFLLGLKHGVEPDHLIAIDGLTRFNAFNKPKLSRWAGSLFSLGHGMVVIAVAASIGVLATQYELPHWTEVSGLLISATILLILGLVNLYGVLRITPNHPYKPVGFKSSLLGRFFQANHPVSMLLVGSLFALSFDTLSLAALFAVAANHLPGWQYPVALAMVFTIGMMLPDAINGIWLSKLLQKADSQAQFLSRLMGGVIAGFSLAIGTVNLTKLIAPGIAEYIEESQMLISLAVILLSTFGFQALLSMRERSRKLQSHL